MSGYIAIHRKIQNNWLWPSNRPYTELESWMWLLLEAAHTRHKQMVDGQLIEVERGEILTSERHLAKVWGWGRNRVAKFLETLQSEGMIRATKRARYRASLKITNYEAFQRKNNTIGATDGATNEPLADPLASHSHPENGHQMRLLATHNNGNNVNKNNTDQPPGVEKKSKPIRDEAEFEEWYQAYPRREAKGDAKSAYWAARKKASYDVLLAGAMRYAAIPKELKYTKLPATWLNKECWKDETGLQKGGNPTVLPPVATNHIDGIDDRTRWLNSECAVWVDAYGGPRMLDPSHYEAHPNNPTLVREKACPEKELVFHDYRPMTKTEAEKIKRDERQTNVI